MSDRPPESISQTPTPPGKKARSPAERAIVWGGIAILLGVLAFEARQKYSYDPTVTKLRKLLSEDSEKHFKLSEIRPMIYGSPAEVKSPHERQAYNRINLKWPSLFKDYQVELIVEREGEDPLIAGFSTPGGTDPEPPPARPAPSGNAMAAANPMGAMPMGAMPMGGGQGRPGAAGRPGGAGLGGGPGAGPGGGPGGPGGGQGGGSRGRGLVAMAQRAEIVAELKLSEEQTAKLTELQSGAREGQEKSVSEVLDEPQFARLLQLMWREAGLTSLERDDVAKALELADEQREKLRSILADRQSGQRTLAGAPPEIVAQKRQEWDDQLRAVLTEEQAKKWEELLGPPAPEPAKAAAATN